MTKTYNLYIEKSNTIYPSSKEVEDANLAQNFALGVYEDNKDEIPDGWKLIKEESSINGFHGEAYEKDGKVIIAFRGTEKTKLNDWWADSQMVRRKVPNQAKSALNFYYEVEKLCKDKGINKKDIMITGHSLGGSNGEIVGSVTGIKTITFNSYGVKDIAKKYIAINLDDVDCVTNYGNAKDLVFRSKMDNHIGKTYVIDKNRIHNFIRPKKFHSIEDMGDTREGVLYRPQTKKSESGIKNKDPNRIIVMEDLMEHVRNKDTHFNDDDLKYLSQQRDRGNVMWQKDVDRKVSSGEVYVHAYTRGDGTHVRDYYRSRPSH